MPQQLNTVAAECQGFFYIEDPSFLTPGVGKQQLWKESKPFLLVCYMTEKRL